MNASFSAFLYELLDFRVPKKLLNFLTKDLSPPPPKRQVAALCRHAENGDVLLITSRDSGRWVVPKGWPMQGRSMAQAARREAWEEAGVRGTIGKDHIGTYHYTKMLPKGILVPLEVQVFLMSVEKLSKGFPEQGQRRRGWFAPHVAASMVEEEGLKQILLQLES